VTGQEAGSIISMEELLGGFVVKQLRIEVIDRAYAAILAAKTPADRAWMIEDCNRTARILLAAGERSRHPDSSQEQVILAVSKRILDGAN
jgi:hypothetical protein